jgi:hypothetical protein
MRKTTVPVEVKIGKLEEIGLTLMMEGISATDPNKPGRTYDANPSVGGLGLSLSVHQKGDPDQHVYARASFKDLAHAVWAELEKELDK